MKYFHLKVRNWLKIRASELKIYIIKNAKRLIEQGPFLFIFTARILLSYLYEDIFHWNCTKDAIEGLNEK
jgi:hypothetical protein